MARFGIGGSLADGLLFRRDLARLEMLMATNVKK
jgi:hypothetical protein